MSPAYASPRLEFVPCTDSASAKIALAKTRIPQDALDCHEDGTVGEDDHRCFFTLKEEMLESLRDRYLATARRAIEHGAEFLCFGEMTYPHGVDGQANSDFVNDD